MVRDTYAKSREECYVDGTGVLVPTGPVQRPHTRRSRIPQRFPRRLSLQNGLIRAHVWFRSIYIKDIYDRRMRIQRPLILTDKDRMYGNTFEMTQRHDHLYTCVQPLEAGRITFTADDRKTNGYQNNLSRKEAASETELQMFWDVLILACIAFVVVGCVVMSILIGTQTAFNDVYLTQFKHDINNAHDHTAYSLQLAGHIKPLPYIIIASLCICSSIVIGWISDPDLHLNQMASNAVTLLIVALQVWGLIFHSIVYDDVRDWNQIQLTRKR